jgi:hypothetical protein
VNFSTCISFFFFCQSLTARVFIRAIAAILFAVAEESALDAVAVAAREEAVLAQRLVRDQQRLHLALLVLGLAVLDGLLPVARLLFDVEEQTGRATNRLQALRKKKQRATALQQLSRKYALGSELAIESRLICIMHLNGKL